LLICDEPTASLDGETGVKVMDTMRRVALHPERCVIVVTHDNRVFSYGDRIAYMLDGQITRVEPGPHPSARSSGRELSEELAAREAERARKQQQQRGEQR
jgi:ABC-type lipoprotein export system ATPase subunit